MEWLKVYDQSAVVSAEIGTLIQEKNQKEELKESSVKIKNQLRKRLDQLREHEKKLAQLLSQMEQNPQAYQIGMGELNRRRQLMRDVAFQIERAEDALEGNRRNRKALGLDGDRRDRVVEENDRTIGQSSQQLYQDHQDRLQKNDQALDNIHSGVLKIKQIAINMNDELEVQDKLLDDVDDGIDRVNHRLHNNQSLLKDVSRRTKAGCGFWIIILLLILIIVLAIV